MAGCAPAPQGEWTAVTRGTLRSDPSLLDPGTKQSPAEAVPATVAPPAPETQPAATPPVKQPAAPTVEPQPSAPQKSSAATAPVTTTPVPKKVAAKPAVADVAPPAAQIAGRDKGEAEPAGIDLFAELRTHPITDLEKPWRALDEALRQFQSLEGASYDETSGQLVLFGTYGDQPGPLSLEDLIVALWAEFQEAESLGVTIDPVPGNMNGPQMDVKFFAHAENSHWGRVMFECDRLLKCLGLGKDNLTQAAITAKVQGYYTLGQLSQQMSPAGANSLWSRFWIVPKLDSFPADDSRGKQVVTMTDDRRAIWFQQTRLYIRTEKMTPNANQTKLNSSQGKQDPAAKYFADHFTANYDDFAQEYPVFQELKELSKLVVLAHWMRTAEIPFDPELMYLRLPPSLPPTPLQTPTLSVSYSVKLPTAIQQLSLFGGVELKTEPFYATDKDQHAARLADAGRQAAADLQVQSVIRKVVDGTPKQLALLPHLPRPPPTAGSVTPPASTPRRGVLRAARQSDGTFKPTNRPTATQGIADADLASNRTPRDEILGDRDLSVFKDLATDKLVLNLPVLRFGDNPRLIGTFTLNVNGREFKIRKPDHLYLTSPLGDVRVNFEKEPKYDEIRQQPYFPAVHANVRGYYPESSSVVLNDGTRIKFNVETGELLGVDGSSRPPLEIVHHRYDDGALFVDQPKSANQAARPPPKVNGPSRTGQVLRRSSGNLQPTTRPGTAIAQDSSQLGDVTLEIRNTERQAGYQVRRQQGEPIFVRIPAP